MAGYAAIEAAIQTIIRTLTGDFASADVSRGDFKIIENGSPNKAIITQQPARTIERGGDSRRTTEWISKVEVLRRYNITDTPRTDLISLMDRIYQKLESYPTLGGLTVNRVAISIDGEPNEIRPDGATADSIPVFLMQSLTIVTLEVWSATGGEYS